MKEHLKRLETIAKKYGSEIDRNRDLDAHHHTLATVYCDILLTIVKIKEDEDAPNTLMG